MEFTLCPANVPHVDAVDFYALISRKDGECIAYLPTDHSMGADRDLASIIIGRLDDAAGDTDEMIQNGDGSFYLAENDDGDQSYFDALRLRLELSELRRNNEVVGYVVHAGKYMLPLMQALNGQEITFGQRNKPKHVGTWVFAVTPQQEFMKWGKEGDTVFPYPPDDKEAVAQAKYLSESPIHKDDVLYILHVFDNGQMKQFEYER